MKKGTLRYRSRLRPPASMRINYRILDIRPLADKQSIITVASKVEAGRFLNFHVDHMKGLVWLFKPWAKEPLLPSHEERTPVGIDGEVLWS